MVETPTLSIYGGSLSSVSADIVVQRGTGRGRGNLLTPERFRFSGTIGCPGQRRRSYN